MNQQNDLSYLESLFIGLLIVVCGILALLNKAEAKDIRVMVIDTGIGNHSMLKGFVQYNNTPDYQDKIGHGTHVAGIILYGNKIMNDKVCSKVKIYSCKYYYSDLFSIDKTVNCIKLATAMNMDYINYSSSGPSFSQEEYNAIKNFNGIFVTSAGNEHLDLTKTSVYPGSYAFDNKRFHKLDNVIVVQNRYSDGPLNESSNYHPQAVSAVGVRVLSTLPDEQYGIMTGTSQAAPEILHLILKQKCKEMTK